MKTFFKLPPDNSFSAARMGGAKSKKYSGYVRFRDITFFDKNPNGTTLISLANGKIITFDDPNDIYFNQLVLYADGFTEATDYYWPIHLYDYSKRYKSLFHRPLDESEPPPFTFPEERPID